MPRFAYLIAARGEAQISQSIPTDSKRGGKGKQFYTTSPWSYRPSTRPTPSMLKYGEDD